MLTFYIGSEHLTTWTGSTPPYGYVDWWPISVYFNNMLPPFDNPKVKWAVAYAINQQQVIFDALGGNGQTAAQPLPEFPRLATYIDQIDDLLQTYNVLEYNLTKSAQLMTEAGFTKDGQGYWADTYGTRLEAHLYASVPLFAEIAPVIAVQLVYAGFLCEHRSPADVWAAMADGRAPLFLWGHGGGVIDPFDTFMLYRQENALPIGEQSWNNLSRWYDDGFTAVTDQMATTPMDDPQMLTQFHDGMAIWLPALPDCPIMQWINRFVMNTRYWHHWPGQDNPTVNNAMFHLTNLLVVLDLHPNNRIFLPLLQKTP